MGFTDYDLRSSIDIERILLRFAGIYPQNKTKTNYLNFLGTCLNFFFSTIQTISVTKDVYIHKNNLSVLSQKLQYFVILLTCNCKVVNLLIYKKNLLELEDLLTSPKFYGFSDKRLNLQKQKIELSKTIGKTFRIMCAVAFVFYALTPFLDPGRTKVLPIPGWFPYNTTKYFYQTYVYQLFGVANTTYTNSTIDILMWMLISVASGQFDILVANLQNIDYKNIDLIKTRESFKECVIHHKEIVKLVYKIEKTFSGGIFLQFFSSVITICIIGFSLMIVPIMSSEGAFLVLYFFSMLLQVGMYCWYGHDLMALSHTIGDAFYTSNWYESDLKVRKSIGIFLENVRKPVILTAGGYIPLSLQTLTTILKSSYSYFAVLRQIYTQS